MNSHRWILLVLICLMALDLRAENQRRSRGSGRSAPRIQPPEPPDVDPNPSDPPPPPPGGLPPGENLPPRENRPTPPPTNARRTEFRETTEDDPSMRLGSEGTLTIDLRKGASLGDEKNPELARLKAVVFTLNSLNKANRRLLKIEDILKDNFGKAEIPKTGDAKVKINLSGILFQNQNSRLRGFLAKDPLICGSNFRARTRELDNGISADSLVRQVYDPENYNLLMVENNRERFDRSLGVVPEFDSPAEGLDQSDNTMRIILAPGDSGVAHRGAERKIVLQKTNYGGLLIRSEDIEKQNASKVSFAVKPVSARGNGHEGIWQLPNGLFAFELRSREGAPLTSAPVTLVVPKITNPIRCLDCHSNGYIATKGEQATERSIDRLRKLDVANEDGIGKKLYKATFEQYQKEIEIANKRLTQALENSGVGNFGIHNFYSQLNKSSFSVEELAKEFNVSEDALTSRLLGDRRFGTALDLRPWKEAQKNKKPFPRLTRQELEHQVDTGGNRAASLYCALKEGLVDSEARRPHRREHGRIGDEDAVVHDSKEKGGHPIVQPNRDEKL